MLPTSRKGLKKNNHGLTYVELSVVILVLSLVVAIVVPNLHAFLRGETYREDVIRLERVGLTAGRLSAHSGAQVNLTFDSGTDELVLSSGEEGTESARESRVPLPSGFEAVRFIAGRGESSVADWRISFYSDGSCNGGSIEFIEDSEARTLVIRPSDGHSSLIYGPAPEPSQERWPAGELEQRA